MRNTDSVGHYIAGEHISGVGASKEVFNPTLGTVEKSVSLATVNEIERAVRSSQDAFEEWRHVNPQRRARKMFRFKELVARDFEMLAKLISTEHGKVLDDARGDVQRGLDVIEFACGIPHLQKGAYTEGAGPGIDVYSMRQPLGVCVGITPFNFPAMIPMWMFGVAIACGNAFVLKPSEKAPSVPMRLAELFTEAGAPAGLLNVVNGDKVAVEELLNHPDTRGVSFVGSSAIAENIYIKCAEQGKRAQCFGGAKNHLIVMPDADMDMVANQLIGAAFGSAGERCMAIPVVVPVGKKTHTSLLNVLVPKIRALKIGSALSEEVDFGPLISMEHRVRVNDYIDLALSEGQDLIVDGRHYENPEFPNGFFMGATLLDKAHPTHRSYQEEIFGPVLQIVQAETFEEAVGLPSKHQYGNGVSIFTQSGSIAREFAQQVEVGMVGINVPIPVPVSYHSFGGWKRSGFGDINQYGDDGVRFWTKVKTVTQRWPEGLQEASFVMPTM